MEDQLVFDSLSLMTEDELKTADRILVSFGIERKKAQSLIQTFMERKVLVKFFEKKYLIYQENAKN